MQTIVQSEAYLGFIQYPLRRTPSDVSGEILLQHVTWMETERRRQAKRTVFLLSWVQRTGNSLWSFARREVEMLSAVVLVGNRVESTRSVFVRYVVCTARHRAR